MKLLVKFIKVYYEVASVGRNKVLFGVEGEVWVVAFVGEEGFITCKYDKHGLGVF